MNNNFNYLLVALVILKVFKKFILPNRQVEISASLDSKVDVKRKRKK